MNLEKNIFHLLSAILVRKISKVSFQVKISQIVTYLPASVAKLLLLCWYL